MWRYEHVNLNRSIGFDWERSSPGIVTLVVTVDGSISLVSDYVSLVSIHRETFVGSLILVNLLLSRISLYRLIIMTTSRTFIHFTCIRKMKMCSKIGCHFTIMIRCEESIDLLVLCRALTQLHLFLSLARMRINREMVII